MGGAVKLFDDSIEEHDAPNDRLTQDEGQVRLHDHRSKRVWPLGARGELPVHFPTSLSQLQYRELVSIPGVVGAPGGVRCTWDAVPIVAGMLGVPAPIIPTDENVDLASEIHRLPGLQRYLDLGFKEKLRPYQKEGAVGLARRAYAMNCDPMRCLRGDAIVMVNRAGGGRRMRLAELVRKFEGGESNGRTWRTDIPTMVAVYDGHGWIVSQELVAVHTVGVKEAWEVTTEFGGTLVASPDHAFKTPDGWAKLRDLGVGDRVMRRHRQATERQLPPANPYRRALSVRNHPHARVYHINRSDRPRETVYRVLKHRLIYEAHVLNDMDVYHFMQQVRSGNLDGLKFLSPDLHIHHRNEDPQDNRPENLEALTNVDYSRRHAAGDTSRHVLWGVRAERITSIKQVASCEMFDLTVRDPLNNYVANDFVVHNSGKTLQALAGSVLTGARKTLIVCPAIAKLVWAAEIDLWLGEGAVLLGGRAGTRGRVFCTVCHGRGYTSTDRHCPGCRSKNGQSSGTRIVRLDEEDPERSLVHTVERARYLIVNYELLVAQRGETGAGEKYYREDLTGWCPFLSRFTFDLAIGDESHLLRGWSSSKATAGQTRREKFNQVTDNIEQVWLLTGTPIFGRTRDLWGQLDAMSRGACSGPSRLPFEWHVRYADGHKGVYGWVADGTTGYTRTELPDRLAVYKIQRPRSLILNHMPAKVRTIHRIEQDLKVVAAQAKQAKMGLGKSKQGRIEKLLAQTGIAKRDMVVENVMAELSAGDKVIVFTLVKRNAEMLAKALRQKIKSSREWAARMRQVDAELWLGHGDVSSQMRFSFARAFVEHTGSAVFVATIDAMPGAVSLKGATSVHFADMHWNPAAMEQAEDRPYEPGTTGLHIIYYIMQGTIDEHVEAVVLPKFKTQEVIVGDESAAHVGETFASPDETLDEIVDRLTSHIAVAAEDDDDMFSDL